MTYTLSNILEAIPPAFNMASICLICVAGWIEKNTNEKTNMETPTRKLIQTNGWFPHMVDFHGFSSGQSQKTSVGSG